MTSFGQHWSQRAGGVATLISGCGLALLLSLTLTGCDSSSESTEGYDPNLHYSLRQDPLVLQTPETNPSSPAPLGQLDASIAALGSQPGGRVIDPNSLPANQREELKLALDAEFGTPAAPHALAGLTYTAEQLALGSRVYRKQCVQCHGLEGNGRGLTGLTIDPHPRDFRQGLYKTSISAKPTVDMLKRVIRRGVGAMQPYDLLPEADVEAVIGYVIHLSVRGEVEFQVMKQIHEDSLEDPVTTACHNLAEKYGKQWATALEVPASSASVQMDWTDPAYQDSIRRGHAQFAGAQASGCISCHTDYGRTERYQYDAWGTAVRIPDLTKGEFRWGRDPAILQARIRHGIPASRMPANPLLTDSQVQDLANFVREVSQPARLPADIREQVERPK